MLRKPIVTVMGHVDHGKTRLLDTIRNTTIMDREAGMITQAIGASIVPTETIERICGPLLKRFNVSLSVPGLLFIDTPGHAAFSNLRRRGGNLADLAIVVIDINEGVMPQTVEAIEILKKYKTPFVVAANKIDLISGWKKTKELVVEDINSQPEEVVRIFDTRLYEIVGRLYELGFSSERFDRIEDYTKQIAIIPIAAKQGWGIAELLMVLSGLAQRYLSQCLNCNVDGPAKGTILEVKEETGLGKTMDVIIYDGTLKVGDTVVIGAIPEPIVTKVKAMFEPAPLSEMRDKKSKFHPVRVVHAATGVKIAVPGSESIIAGMPLMVATSDIEKVKEEIKDEIEEVIIETNNEGIVVKAESLGGLEAVVTLIKEKGIPIKKALVGNITKKDFVDAQCNIESDPLHCVILGFNVEVSHDAEDYVRNGRIKIITNKVIYRLLEDYDKWIKEQTEIMEKEKISGLIKPGKIEIMRGYVFRQSNPAVFGAHVLAGEISPGAELIKNDGTRLGNLKSIQEEQKNIEKATKGKQVAVSVENLTIGRQASEGDILYVLVPEDHFRKFKELKKLLSSDSIEVLKELAEIMRKQNPTWGI
ncbi:MAG: translation initiation factor IF-2 [Candidatus Woesearchaeota archaeon]